MGKRKKVTEELLSEMIDARKSGSTLPEIESRFGVSRWTTLHYLKDVVIEKGVAEALWRKAEKKAIEILVKKGFIDIIDLNVICPTGFFDILATKDGSKWLIDVTINESKDLATKSIRVIPQYRCAVLYMSHNMEDYRLVELKEIDFE